MLADCFLFFGIGLIASLVTAMPATYALYKRGDKYWLLGAGFMALGIICVLIGSFI